MKKEYDSTLNRSVYNKLRKIKLEHTGLLNCSYCPYHKYENYTCKWYGGFIDYKDMTKRTKRFPNWKLVSKNKKQWMTKKTRIEVKYEFNTSYFHFIF